jgi:hypothetical protein
MRGNAAYLAPCQELRSEVGLWLRDNTDHGDWVISSDIGAIAYNAPDCKYIDLNGLTSPDIVAAYQLGTSITPALSRKSPRYIADTFTEEDGMLVYNHPELHEFLSNHRTKILYKVKFTNNIYIGIVEVMY